MEELIKQITEILSKIEYDLLTAMVAMVLLATIMFVNQILGAVMASTVKQFDIQRLLKSFLKGILICIGILLFCIVLDVFPVLLERVKVLGGESIIPDIVTVLEVTAILVIAIVKYCKEVYQKLLTLFDVKKEEVDELIQTTFNNDTALDEVDDEPEALG